MKFTTILLLCLCCWGAQAATTAMITDLEGKATLRSKNANVPLAILDTLAAGDEVQLAEAGRLVLVYVESGSEYRLSGPALIRVGEQEPELIEGRLEEMRVLNGVSADSLSGVSDLRQAAVVMRGDNREIALLSPRNTLMKRPERLRWERFHGAGDYHVTLESGTGEVLMDTWTDGTVLTLPEDVALNAGETYLWVVESRLASGKSVAGSADFRVLGSEEKSMIVRLRPDPAAPVSEHVTYALLLEQMGLQSEARRQWALIADRRPGDPNLAQKARGCAGDCL